MTSSILRTATRLLMPLLLLFALFLLLRGHNEPGGGFVGRPGGRRGLRAARDGLRRRGQPAGAARVDPSTLLRDRPAVALIERPARGPARTAVHDRRSGRRSAPDPAPSTLGTPLLFDVGVFLAVIGVVLTIIFSWPTSR